MVLYWQKGNPEYCGSYLVTTQFSDEYEVGVLYWDGRQWKLPNDKTHEKPVTAWANMPNPYVPNPYEG